MKKSQIQFHSDGFRSAHPALNVKCRHFVRPEVIQARFRCCGATAEKALEYVWQSAQDCFWEDAKESAEYCLGKGYRVYSEGRSGGWLVVHDMPSVESWDAILVSRWSRCANEIAQSVEWVTSDEYAIDMIEANEWAKADALLDDDETEASEAQEWAARGVVTV